MTKFIFRHPVGPLRLCVHRSTVVIYLIYRIYLVGLWTQAVFFSKQ